MGKVSQTRAMDRSEIHTAAGVYRDGERGISLSPTPLDHQWIVPGW